MAKYLVETDNGKFEIETEEPESPMLKVGEEKSLAEMASSAVTSDVQPTKEGFIPRMARATKEAFLSPLSPFIPGLRKRVFSPLAGQAGLTQPIEEAGERLGQAVRGSTANIRGKYPLASELPAVKAPLAIADVVSGGLKPSEMQTNIGGEGVGLGVRLATPGIVKGTSVLSELLSGADRSNFQRLAKDPKALLPRWMGGPVSKKVAGAEKGAVEKELGLVTSRVEEETGKLSKTLKKFEGKPNPFEESNAKGKSYFDRVSKGEQLTPQEKLEAFTASEETLNKTPRKDQHWYKIYDFKETLKKELRAEFPKWGEALDKYARSAMGESVTNIFPRTRTGRPSIGRIGFGTLATGGGFLNPVVGAGALLTSPLVHGTATAGLASLGHTPPGLLAILQKAARKQLGEKQTKPVPQNGGDTKKLIKSFMDRVSGVNEPETKEAQEKLARLFKKIVEPESTEVLAGEKLRNYGRSKNEPGKIGNFFLKLLENGWDKKSKAKK